jgi:hypothetical protein
MIRPANSDMALGRGFPPAPPEAVPPVIDDTYTAQHEALVNRLGPNPGYIIDILVDDGRQNTRANVSSVVANN